MIDYGIYEVRKDGDHYVVIDQLSGDTNIFLSMEGVVRYIKESLESCEKGGFDEVYGIHNPEVRK